MVLPAPSSFLAKISGDGTQSSTLSLSHSLFHNHPQTSTHKMAENLASTALPVRLNKSPESQEPTPTITLTKPATNTTLLDVLSLYPVCDRLCSHLDVSGLLLLKTISKSLSGNIEAHLKQRWDINRKLTRFVREPKRLRSLMGKHDALISGKYSIPQTRIPLSLCFYYQQADLEVVISRKFCSPVSGWCHLGRIRPRYLCHVWTFCSCIG